MSIAITDPHPPSAATSHRSRIVRVSARRGLLGGHESLWKATCHEGCFRYFTDGGWSDALSHALHHYDHTTPSTWSPTS